MFRHSVSKGNCGIVVKYTKLSFSTTDNPYWVIYVNNW